MEAVEQQVHSRRTSVSDRIPSLDGLRALSIAGVVVAHATGMASFQLPAAVEQLVLHLGQLGVRVFFVISGYLITSILFRELAKTGTLNVRKFYFRRTLRLMPGLYVLIGTVALLSWLGWLRLDEGDLFHAATYTMNFHHPHAWWLAHSWSLGVEEQFYLLWPAILLACGRRGGLWICAAFVLLGPFIRAWSFYHGSDSVGESFQTIADAVAAGCLLAGLRPWLHEQPLYRRLLDSRASWLVLLGTIVTYLAFASFFRVELTVGPTVLNLEIALCIDYCLRHPAGKVGRVLNSAPMVAVGVGSYSIYLWQQIFLNRTGDWSVHSFPAALIAVAAAATLSYFLVERPFMRLRETLERAWAARGRSKLEARPEDVAQRQREVGGLVTGQVELAELRQNRKL